VYQAESTRELLKGSAEPGRKRLRGLRVSRNVLLLGLTSLFTDISSEMVATIIPLYLVFGLGVSPLQFGVVDGLYQGVTVLVRLLGGYVADRSRRHKEVAALGYGISTVCKLGFAAVGSSWGAFTSIVVADRAGKGIRTAPRDALISLSTTREKLATAFGVHRALDTAGAMLGPLLAFVILAVAPRAFDAVFFVSFLMGAIGLSILILFVENRSGDPDEQGNGGAPERRDPPVSLRTVLGLLRSPRFRVLTLAAAALALFTMSDGFVYLALQRRLDFDERFLPLLYVGTALVYMTLAIPVGRLADRLGRGRVFISGYVLLLCVYGSLLLPDLGLFSLVPYLLAFGIYYAATDGVLMALASTMLPAELRGSGLALLVTAISLARLLASVLFGTLWTWVGMEAAIVFYAAGLVVVMSISFIALLRTNRGVAHA
jgi:MFS family permease